MKKEVGVIILTLLVVALVALTVFSMGNTPRTPTTLVTQPTNTEESKIATSEQETLPEKISSLELEKHNSLIDCWVSYKGKVYDITNFLPKHPGSANAILPYCGSSSDFEKAFTDQHGSSQVSKLMEQGTLKGDLE